MPTNEQRRETAKRKLERQLERRTKQARQRRIATIAAAIGAVVVAIGATTTTVLMKKGGTHSEGPAVEAPGEPGAAGQLPRFSPSGKLGDKCEYPRTTQPASKAVKPPRSGKVPTDPAEVSVSMMTDQGPVGLLLANAKSPCTVNSFISLATQKFFDNTQCHRLTVVPSLSVLQCGDPSGNGGGGPGYQFTNEYPTDQYQPGDPALAEPVTYPRGTVAMAHSPGQHNNGSQFFLVYQDSQLPPDYTVFGKIQDDGLATLDKIAAAGVEGDGGDGPPATKVTITSVLPD